jgi:four helix bundle protein
MRDGQKYDLEERTLAYALKVREFIKKLPKTLTNKGDCIQLANASGSVGANYIEANDGVSKQDFLYRAKVSKKEAKESTYWLKLVDTLDGSQLETERSALIAESIELTKIFAAIIKKFEQ